MVFMPCFSFLGETPLSPVVSMPVACPQPLRDAWSRRRQFRRAITAEAGLLRLGWRVEVMYAAVSLPQPAADQPRKIMNLGRPANDRLSVRLFTFF